MVEPYMEKPHSLSDFMGRIKQSIFSSHPAILEFLEQVAEREVFPLSIFSSAIFSLHPHIAYHCNSRNFSKRHGSILIFYEMDDLLDHYVNLITKRAIDTEYLSDQNFSLQLNLAEARFSDTLMPLLDELSCAIRFSLWKRFLLQGAISCCSVFLMTSGVDYTKPRIWHI